MSVVRDFCGHGLGRLFHDEPNIVHFGRPGEGIVLKPGMFFTVEPMINLGRPHVKVLSDGWTAVTRDRSLSAQFEHTVGVTQDRLRDLHALAEGPPQAAYVSGSAAEGPFPSQPRIAYRHHEPPRSAQAQRVAWHVERSPREASGERSRQAPPHYHGHRDGCATRFREAGAEALSDYEMLELLLFRAMPRATSSRSPRRCSASSARSPR